MTRNLVCRSLRNGAGGLALALMAGIVFPLGAQETGTITGQITDEGSGPVHWRPARCFLEGTAFGTLHRQQRPVSVPQCPGGRSTRWACNSWGTAR